MQHETSSVTLKIVAWIIVNVKPASSGPRVLSYFVCTVNFIMQYNSLFSQRHLKYVLACFYRKTSAFSVAFQVWYKHFVIQYSQYLVLVSGLGLNFQLFVLMLPCTCQGILHPPHLACLIKGNKAGYQSTCMQNKIEIKWIVKCFRASLCKRLNHVLKAE